MALEPEMIADYACVCGEGPLWHPGEKKLYWTDIETGRLFRFDPATDQHEQCYSGETVGGFTIQDDGALLLFGAKGSIRLWRDGNLTTVREEITEERDSRFNDVIADPQGRVFCGTMPAGERLGSLYRLDTDGTLTPVVADVTCSNGMGFTPDRKQMYFTDSGRFTISRFAYEEATGYLSDRRLFVQSPENEGFPDGMTVDAEGCVWSARWDGSMLARFSLAGEELLRVPFPARKVSSVVFGGEDYRDIYVTTAGGDKKAEDGSLAGALFRIRLGIQGVPEFPSRLRV